MSNKELELIPNDYKDFTKRVKSVCEHYMYNWNLAISADQKAKAEEILVSRKSTLSLAPKEKPPKKPREL